MRRRPAVTTLTLALVAVPLLPAASPAAAASPTSVVTTSRPSLAAGETATVTFTFSEPVVGFDHGDLVVTGGVLGPVAGSGTTYTATFTPTAGIEGQAQVRVDNTGVADAQLVVGTGTSSVTMAVDTQGPQLAGPITVSDTVLGIDEVATVTFTFSEAVTGFTAADVTVPNGVLGPVSSSDGGITWTAALTPAAGVQEPANALTLHLTGVRDLAGNPGQGTAVSPGYAVGTARPTATVVVADDLIGIGRTSLVTIRFSGAVSGFSAADLTAGLGTLTGPSSTDGGVTWTATLTPAADAEGAAQVVVLDLSGVVNVHGNPGSGVASSDPYVVDTRRPTATVDVAPAVVGIGRTAAVTITFSEPVTGLTPAAVPTTGGTLTGLGTADGGVTWTATFVPAAATETTSAAVRVDTAAVRDRVGNAGSGVVSSVPLAVDTVAPSAALRLATTRVTGPTTLTVTFSEPVATLTLADLVATRGTLSALATTDGGRTWTATFTPDAGVSAAAVTIRLDLPGVTDLAGNAGSSAVLSAAFAVETPGGAVPATPVPAAPAPAAAAPDRARPALARTGSDALALLGAAAALLAAGLAAVRTRRRPAP